MKQKLTQFFKDDLGATAIEYGLIISAVAGGIIVALNILGVKTGELFKLVTDAL